MFRYLEVLICLSLISAQANCGGEPPNIEILEISGELTYRERIPPPPESTAVVELLDVSIADAPSVLVAEQRIDLAGRQVPVAFILAVDRSRLTNARRYSVRGAIMGPDQQLLWTTTETHLVDPAAGKAELGTLMMTRASDQE